MYQYERAYSRYLLDDSNRTLLIKLSRGWHFGLAMFGQFISISSLLKVGTSNCLCIGLDFNNLHQVILYDSFVTLANSQKFYDVIQLLQQMLLTLILIYNTIRVLKTPITLSMTKGVESIT